MFTVEKAKKKKVLQTLFLGLLFIVILTACSQSEEGSISTNNDEEEAEMEALPVRWVLPGHAPDDQGLIEEEVNKRLKENGLNLTYEAIYIPWDVWDQRTNLMMSTGEEFEIIQIMHDNKPPNIIANDGGIIPINELLDEHGSDLLDSVPEWMWESVKSGDDILSVPAFWLETGHIGGGNGTYTIRTDLLEDNNLEPPTSPEELLDTAEILQENWPDSNQNVYIQTLYVEPATYLHESYDTYPFTVFENIIFIDQEGNVEPWIETEEFKQDVEFF